MAESTLRTDFADKVKTEGILCEGFGLIYKLAMCDPNLSITAKGIYAYICAFAGNKDHSFPSQDRMRNELKLGKDAFYSNLKMLSAEGYLRIEQSRASDGPWTHNIYWINDNPKSLDSFLSRRSSLQNQGTLSWTGIKGAGFGVIPKAIMVDQRLSVKAKALYAYFASYAGSEAVAFPSKKDVLYQLNLSNNSYSKYINELIALNYLKRVQRHDSNGLLSVNDYFLISNPDLDMLPNRPEKKFAEKEAQPFTKNPDTINPDTINPDTINPEAMKPDTINPETTKPDAINPETTEPDTIKPDTMNPDTNKTSSKTNSSYKNQSHQNQSSVTRIPSAGSSSHWIDKMDRKEQRTLIEKQIHFADLAVMESSGTITEISNLIDMVVDTLQTKKEYITISGTKYDRATVIERLLSLEYEHYLYVLEAVSRSRTPIKNVKAYYIASLFNAPSTYELYMKRRIEEDDFATTEVEIGSQSALTTLEQQEYTLHLLGTENMPPEQRAALEEKKRKLKEMKEKLKSGK